MSIQSVSSFEQGIPPHEFFGAAWASEPLTGILENTNIPFALPMPDADASLVAKDSSGKVVGQISANRGSKYWTHIEKTDAAEQNQSTKTFMRIHELAVRDERAHFSELGLKESQALHSAGVAVLPECRGQGLGLKLREKQIERARELGAKVLYCETTNKYSARTVREKGFEVITEYRYADLAETLDDANLKKLDDAFTVWYLKI